MAGAGLDIIFDLEYLFGSVQSLRPYLPLLALSSATLLTFTYQINIFTSLLGQVRSLNTMLHLVLSAFSLLQKRFPIRVFAPVLILEIDSRTLGLVGCGTGLNSSFTMRELYNKYLNNSNYRFK